MDKQKKTAAMSGAVKTNKLRVAAIAAGAAAVLLAVCFFTYRFLFPEEASAPGGEPPVALTADEMLAGAAAEAEAARKKTVQDYPLTVYAGEEELSALYSGALYNGVPYGSGYFKFSGPEGEWVFSGDLKNGNLNSGQVTDYPFAFDLSDSNATSKYTGKLAGGMPKGEGLFEVIDDAGVMTLHGSFDDGSNFTGTVENYPLAFSYNAVAFDGRFTGGLVSGIPEGDGQYTGKSESGNYYDFSGAWQNGNPVGPGRLSTDCASFTGGDGTDYIAVYNGGIEDSCFSGEGDMTIGDEASGGYSYHGGWKDGAFSGEGKLICYDPSGSGYTYEGGFSGGAYHGYGKLVFDDENIIKYIGNFEHGSFRPTVTDLMEAFSTAGSSPFTLNEQVRDYLSAHGDALLSHNTEGLNFGSGFSYENYITSGDNQGDRCFTTTLKLVQKSEYDASAFGYPVTELLGFSNNHMYTYYGYYFGSLSAVKDDGFVELTAYPIGTSYLRDNAGNDVPVLRFVAFEAIER